MSEPKPEYKVAGVVTQNPWRCLSCGTLLGFWSWGSGLGKKLEIYRPGLVATCIGEADIPCTECSKVRVWNG